jgi:hypothetical protein
VVRIEHAACLLLVDREPARELRPAHTGFLEFQIQGGVIVSSGRFTSDAVEFARQAGIELIAGPALRRISIDFDPHGFENCATRSKCGATVLGVQPIPAMSWHQGHVAIESSA